MKRRWVKLAVVVVGMMGVGAARAGLLMLADGRTVAGTVTLVAGVGGGDGKVMVQPAGKAAVSANLADVRKAVFGPRGSTSSKECDGVRWVKTQLGSGSRAGRAEINGNKVTIYDASEGFRIARGNRRDPAAMRPYACCFVFQQLQGDGTIMAKVLPSVEGPKTTRAGVMICEGVEGSGPFVFVSRTPDQAGGAMLWRTRGEAIFSTEETGKEGRAVPMPTSGPAGLPKAWVKLVRKATATRNEMEIEAFESANGVTWAKIGEIRRLPVDEKAGIYIGVAATGNLREGAMASFEGIQMTGKRSEPEIVGVQDVYLPDVHTLLADGTVLPVVVESMKALGEAKVKWPENLGGSGGTLVIPGGELVRTQFGALTRQQVERLLRAGGGGGGGGGV
ncbi:MAG: hypothetical protein FWD61_08620, partial [Phycisphaerales bacterium]|nr:hypothetical protein [Phycisphaerales bacterium]